MYAALDEQKTPPTFQHSAQHILPGRNAMMRSLVVALIALSVAMPAFGKTYKTTYPNACSELWPAVREVLSNEDNYAVVSSDDAQMTAIYDVKHSTHVNISGALLQRKNHVTLVSQGTGCEMQVVSNYSGWEHNDQGDFKTRVEESLAKLKGTNPAEPAKAPEVGK
jgi:hypothetical protein